MRLVLLLAVVAACRRGEPIGSVDTDRSDPVCATLPLEASGACDADGCLTRDELPLCGGEGIVELPDLVTPEVTSCTTAIGQTFDVVSGPSDGATRLYLDGFGQVVAVHDPDAEDCAAGQWWGRDLSGCTGDGTVVDVCEEPDDTAADPAFCFLTPLEAAGWCPGGTCVRPADVLDCDGVRPPLDLEGTCLVAGVTYTLHRRGTLGGPLETLYFDPLQRLVAVSLDDDVDGTCTKWWGADLSLCESTNGAATFGPTCPVDTGDSDVHTADTAGDDSGDTGTRPPAWDLRRADLVITELHVDPEGCGDSLGEYIEVLNDSGSTLDLDGLVITDGTTSHVHRGTLSVPFGGRVVFQASAVGCFDFGAVGDAAHGWPPELVNTGSQIALQAGPAGVVIDAVDFRTWRFGDGRVAPRGRALELQGTPTTLTNDDPANWCASDVPLGQLNHGTPGSPPTPGTCFTGALDTADDSGTPAP